MNSQIKIGFIGLGNMGIPMVKNLVKAGYEVTVYNRNIDKANLLKEELGVAVADHPSALLPESNVIISMLTDDAAVNVIYGGPEGLIAANTKENLIIIDMSTVAAATSIALSETAQKVGISYLDAPVSGSVKPATDAQLVIMVGGDQQVFEKVKPILLTLGKSATYLGLNGSGNIAKLAINLFLGITIQGLTEAVVFAAKNGISSDALLPLINDSAVGSGITKVKTENIINRNFKPAFALKLLRKDIKLAEDLGMDTPAGKTLAETLQLAIENGYGEEDMVAILKEVEQARN